MRIEEVTRFVIDGREFPNRHAAESYEFDRLGEFVEAVILRGVSVLSPRDRITLAENISNHRAELLQILGE